MWAANMTKKTHEQQLAERREAYRNLPPDVYAARRAAENARQKRKRMSETPEERERRLAPMRERARIRLLNETPEQREKRLAYFKKYKPKYTQANKARIKETSRAYYEANKERIIRHGKEYRKQTRQAAAERERRKRKQNAAIAIASRLRCRLRSALASRGNAKSASTFSLVGCSPIELARWIELQFEPGMGWDNRSKWHVDHIIPCNAFDLSDDGQQAVAFHFTNLRPLWASLNIAKRDKVPVCQRRFVWTLKDIAEARERLGLIQHNSGARKWARAI